MAILIPEAPKSCPNGERLVYERIGRELPDGWVALHSLGLPNHEKKIWGEADIVILSTAGVFAIEVKGGKVSCADGVWTFGGPDFQSYSKKEDPWTQAKSAMMAVRERLQAALPEFRDKLFGYGVVMPFTPFTVPGVEFTPEVLLDKRHFRQPLNLYISALERYWRAEYERKHGRTYQGVTPDLIRKARQILRPDLETAISIGGWLTGVESQLLHLTNEQIRTSRRMAANPRTIVRGAAGTGKSVLALDRALHHAGHGSRVLFLCFNQLLATHVRESIEGNPKATGIDVRHAHVLYREIIAAGGLLAKLEALDPEHPDFFARQFPQLAADALCETAHAPWDVVIVDEAQDLFTRIISTSSIFSLPADFARAAGICSSIRCRTSMAPPSRSRSSSGCGMHFRRLTTFLRTAARRARWRCRRRSYRASTYRSPVPLRALSASSSPIPISATAWRNLSGPSVVLSTATCEPMTL